MIVGSIAIDTIEIGTERYEKLLGGSTTYATIAAGKYSDVNVVGVIGTDFPQYGHDIYDKYANNLSDLKVEQGKTFSWGGRYYDNFDDRDTLFTELGVFGKFDPKLSVINKNQQFVFLANIHPSLQNSVIDQCQANPVIIIDTMNLWIDTTHSELLTVLSKSDILLINESEAEMLTDCSNLDDAATILIGLGPPTVVIKRGSKGAALYSNMGEKITIGVYPIDKVVDPTGAGDTFGGGFVSALAQGKTYKEALVLGSALASICVEGVGIDTLERATITEIEHRQIILQDKVTS
ncbi:MAG: bifunctional hydroxymethylpyrimidine kinase/phosphomethylpyrimidine kinase [Candidatus Marinimicrobia bacterium]|nr:bifunctional hydroxymethylpyrimidine kinase/phosphomethylpyrimidine kinase [Candidatus Neomarinimicrobiota bacterium]